VLQVATEVDMVIYFSSKDKGKIMFNFEANGSNKPLQLIATGDSCSLPL
jgi:hypothetical protein